MTIINQTNFNQNVFQSKGCCCWFHLSFSLLSSPSFQQVCSWTGPGYNGNRMVVLGHGHWLTDRWKHVLENKKYILQKREENMALIFSFDSGIVFKVTMNFFSSLSCFLFFFLSFFFFFLLFLLSLPLLNRIKFLDLIVPVNHTKHALGGSGQERMQEKERENKKERARELVFLIHSFSLDHSWTRCSRVVPNPMKFYWFPPSSFFLLLSFSL